MPVPPPPSSRAEEVVDVLHGVEVADPHRWLERGDDPEVVAWVAAQEARTAAVLSPLPQRRWAHARLVELLGAPVSVACEVAGPHVFTLERGGGRAQAVLVVRPADDRAAPGRVVVDPAATGDPTTALDWYHPSPDGRLVAYGTSTGGSELSALRGCATSAPASTLPDAIPHTRAASVAWLPDGSGFAYTCSPADEVATATNRRVRWHALGADPAHDDDVWSARPDPAAWPDVSLSPDGRHLLVHVSVGWSRVDVHLLDRVTGRWTTVVEGEDAVTSLRVVGDRLVGVTTLGAPRGRLVAAPVDDPVPARWTTLVAESEAVLGGVVVAGPWLLLASTLVAVARLHRLPRAGGPLEEVPLPGPASIAGLDGARDRAEAFLQLESFARPPSLHRWTPDGGVAPWGERPPGGLAVDPDDYVVERAAYPSSDGVEVPAFVLRRRDVGPGPTTPAVLTGYGGFAIAMEPAWSPASVAACDAGAVVVVAGLRGGAEHGEDWHLAGTRERKPQVFEDLEAAADWLVATGRTDRHRLAIRGGSNGGLLVAAAITRRPDLCRAAVAAVPLTDMVRYADMLIGRLWVPEYGDPAVAADLAFLHAYSPYHRVVEGTCYPATLLTTADQDSRVDPAHARKMAARLQRATACGGERPVLLRGERAAGHGQGKPLSAQADEGADVLAFLLWQLGVDARRLVGSSGAVSTPTALDAAIDDAIATAEEAGLRYARDDSPGMTRRRSGRGWSYRDPRGRVVADAAERARIAAIAIPPAWTDVWISPDPEGHILATGRDAKGRKQYRYHPRWREVRDADKFDRMAAFGLALPELRRRIEDDLARRGLPRERVLATVVHLLDETLIRVGNAEYANDNESFGLTTITPAHVDVAGSTIRFAFKGKSGILKEGTVRDRQVAAIVRRCEELPGQDLFQYLDEAGQAVDVTSSDVNRYLQDVTSAPFTAKDFRTWGGTVVAAEALAAAPPPDTAAAAEAEVLAAYDAAATTLGNTRAVARACYVHPRIPEAFRDGTLQEAWRRARASSGLRRGERAVLSVVSEG